MEEPKLYSKAKGYALIFGAGGAAALQAMKMDLFSFPDGLKMYLGYFFSIVTIFSVFLGGFSLLKTIQDGSEVLNRLKNLKEHEAKKAAEEKEAEPEQPKEKQE